MTAVSIIAQIEGTASAYGVDPALAVAVAEAESSFNPGAVGGAGEIGLFQLMPDTAAELGVTNRWDIGQNIAGGIRYLRKMLDRYGGDETRALAAYNGGPGNMDRGTTPASSWEYARRVIARAGHWATPGVPAPTATWARSLPGKDTGLVAIAATIAAGSLLALLFD